MNGLIIAGGAILLLFGKKIFGAFSAKKVSNNLIIDIRDFTLSPLGFNLVFTNPTRSEMKITRPVIQIYINGESVAYSESDNTEITIPSLDSEKLKIKFKNMQTAYLKIPGYIAKGLKNLDVEARYSLYANDIFVKGTKIIKQSS